MTDYYVHTGGNNANPGTVSKPFKTIARAVQMSSNGDTIYVASGTYKEHVVVNKQVSIVGDPITKSYIDGNGEFPTGDKGVFSGLVEIAADSVTIASLVIARSAACGISASGYDDVTIDNVDIYNPSRNGIIISGATLVSITDSKIEGARTRVDLARSDRRGAALEVRDCTNVLVSFNEVHDNDWQGIGIVECTSAEVSDNILYDNLGTQLYIDGLDSGDVYNNQIFYTTKVRTAQRQAGIHIARDIYPLGSGASASTAIPNRDIDIYNNITVGVTNPLIHRGGFATVYNRDNAGNVTADTVDIPDYKWEDIVITNNTFVLSSKPLIIEKERDLFVYGSAGDVVCILADNIIHTTGTTTLQWRREDIGTYVMAGNLHSSTPPLLKFLKAECGCTGIQIGDPMLVNMGAVINSRSDWNVENYKARQESPANDKGYYYNAIATDFFGTSIPGLGPYPVGFHRYTATNDDIITADFAIDDVSGNVPHEVQFTDKSTGTNKIVKWAWSFGDGEISTERSPRHVYTRAGSFTVTLTVTDSKGQTGRKTVSNAITVSFSGTTPTSSNRTRIESGYVRITKTVGVNATQAHNMTYKPDVLLVNFGSYGNSGGIYDSTLGWFVLVDQPTDDELGISAYLGAWDESGAIAAGHSVLRSNMSWYDGNSGSYRSLVFTWDEDYIYVTDGSPGPAHTVNLEIMAFGGPDMQKKLVPVSTTVIGAGSSYQSGDIGFKPDLLLGWTNKQYPTTEDADNLAYEFHIGYYASPANMGSIAYGRTTMWEANWGSSSGKWRDDRFLSMTSRYTQDKGVGAEITENGFNIYTSHNEQYDCHVLALNFGDLNFHAASHASVLTTSGGSSATTEVVLGWQPQMVFGFTSWFKDNAGYVGSAALATGIYFNDGVNQRTTQQFAYTPYTNIGIYTTDLLACISQGVLNSAIYRASVNFQSDGYDIVWTPGGFGTEAGRYSMLIALEDGTTDPITAGFSVNKLTALTGTNIRVTNRTYTGGLTDLQYSYTWTGGGSSTQENPIITFATPGSKTITLTVTSASNPNITDQYSVIVYVEDAYIVPKIDVDYGQSYNVNATVGERVVFNDLTVAPTGTTIVERDWTLSVVQDGVPRTVAQAEGTYFDHIPAEAGRYVVSLHVVLDDGRSGTIQHDFVADISLAPVVRINTYAIATATEEMGDNEFFTLTAKYRNISGGVGRTRYPVPATFRFKDTSDTLGREVLLRQWLIAPAILYGRLNIPRLMEYSQKPMSYLTGGIWSYTGSEQIDFTFDEPGEYFVTLVIKTSGGVGYYSRPVVIIIGEQRQALIGPPGPALVGPQSRSVIDGWGNHSHALDTTVSGEPSKVVVTDAYGGIHAKYFKVVGQAESEEPAMRIEGTIDIAGDAPEIAGETIALNANYLKPAHGEVSLGDKNSRFQSLHAAQVDAGQLAQVGDVNAVGGSIFVGRSYGLIQGIGPEDSQIIVTDGDKISVGDYLYFSRENTVELMRVESNPITVGTDRDTWKISVARGAEVGAGYVASAWNVGDVCLNLGGSTDDDGVVVPTSWIEMLADESIMSRLVDPGLAEGPVMAGSYRYGADPTDWYSFFAIGRLDGMYGIPEGVHKVGVVFGKDVSGAALFQVDDDGLQLSINGDSTILRFADDGISLYAATVNESSPHRSDITKHALKFRHPADDRLTGTLQQTFDENNRQSILKLSAPPQPPSWQTGVMMRAYSADYSVAAVSIISQDRGTPLIRMINLPTSDPGVANALWIDTANGRVLKVSSG